MAWGLEARVPFLDKAFLEVAMNVDPAEKQFSKGSQQEFDEDGRPRMEKVRRFICIFASITDMLNSLACPLSTSSGKLSTVHRTASHTFPHPSCGARRSSSQMELGTRGLTGRCCCEPSPMSSQSNSQLGLAE